jgi:1-deoxy-D-xylulose-5-phosphate reductoisomerase
MGPKITIDSATLMNKGLEVIEAHHLFGVDADQIGVVIHPQSIIHSMVEFVDGTFLAQLSSTDMKVPILYALNYPMRFDSRLPSLDLFQLSSLEFREPDLDRFACLRLAYQALKAGKTYPTVLNAVNEVAVEKFLRGEIKFTSIAELIEKALSQHQPEGLDDLETILSVDQQSREEALSHLRV